MGTSLKTGFAQIFSCCPKNLSCPKFGGAAAPLAPPARTPMLRALKFYICKFEVNGYHTTRFTKFWSNLTFKCHANTLVKVDTQIVEECRRTLYYLKGYSYSKLYCKKTRGEYGSQYKKNNFMLNAG